ncbi:MAG: hypothetical protein P8J32_08330 [bacterium]|nr:hypothetical protein [bacterium]
MPQNEQTSLEKAFLDFKSLKDTAKAELMGQLEEKVEERILSLMNEEIQEEIPSVENQDKEAVNEGVTVTIDVDGDDVKVDTADTVDAEDLETITAPEDAEEMFEISDDAESYQIENEMNNLEENEPIAPEMGGAPEAAPAPAPEAAPEAEMGDAEIKIIDGIKALIAQDGGDIAAGPEAGGEIDIVDDAPEAAAAGAPPVAEDFDMEEIFEIIDEMDIGGDDYVGFDGRDKIGPDKDDITLDDVSEDEELYEIALELDEDDEAEGEEELEEMKAMGHGHGVRRTTGQGAGPEVAVKNRSRKATVKESNTPKGVDAAQYEATLAELNKENESLKAKVNEQKGEIKKFHQSFVELRSQFNEMQTFNAKLAYANKLFANGGFSEKEKLQIAESFDQASTADDAKKLYNSIISENKLSVKDIKSEISATPSRAAKPQAKSEHVVLHESAEMQRMKKLAGINRRES